MRKDVWQQGLPGVKWGVWNTLKREWQFEIEEDTPMLAQARLYQKIGDDARKVRFEIRSLPRRRRGIPQ